MTQNDHFAKFYALSGTREHKTRVMKQVEKEGSDQARSPVSVSTCSRDFKKSDVQYIRSINYYCTQSFNIGVVLPSL